MIKKEKRISTILALLLVFIGIGATAFLVEDFQNTKTHAQPSIIPQEINITNLSTNGFTVSWITEEKTQGFVAFGEEKSLGKTAFDERDKEENLDKYFTHHVNIKNLKPSSTYYFKIISQSKTFDQNGFPYGVKTTPVFSNSPSLIEPAYGTVLNKNNSPAEGVIVYLNFKGTLPLSTLTKSSGNFLISLNLAVKADLNGYFIPKEKEEEEITVRAGINETTTAITDTENDSPVPTMILGKSYDFRTRKEKENKSLTKKQLSPKVLGIEETSPEVVILFPKEGTPLLDPKPLFKGKGIFRNEVIIKIESPTVIEETVVVNTNGQWFFRPEEPLSPGKHTITITTKDRGGKKITLNQSFFILKSGTQVLGESTPSATLTPTPSPTITPALSPTITPTPPVLSPAPTSPPITPTPSLTPGIFSFTVKLLSLGAFLLLIGGGLLLSFH